MIWWLRSRRVGLVAAVSAATMALVAVVGDVVIPMPSLLRAATVPTLAAVFLPLLVGAAVQHTRQEHDVSLERTGVRHVARLDAALYAAVAAGMLILAVLGHVMGAATAAAGARNAIGYLGLGLIAARVAPQAGAVAPALYVFILALFSTGSGGDRVPWQWPLHDGGSTIGAAAALVLFAGGVAAVLVWPPIRAANAT